MRSFYSNNPVLILGAGGYIGTMLKVHILSLGGSVILPGGNLRELDWESLLPEAKVIFHLAAETDECVIETFPASHLQEELIPTIKMLDVIRKMPTPPRLIFAGTVTQVGFTHSDVVVTESTPSIPVTFYDVTKQMIEQTLRAYSTEYNLETATLRLPNVYGSSYVKSGPNRGFLNILVKKAVRGETIKIDYHLLGKMRDFIDILDVVEAFLLAGCGPREYLAGQRYIVGTGKSYTFSQVIKILERELASPISVEKIHHLSNSPIVYRSFRCDPGLMQKAFGWTAKISLGEGLKELIKFYE